MNITRRDLLGLLAASPFVAGGCCSRTYPHSMVSVVSLATPKVTRAILAPAPRTDPGLDGLDRVIDVHAHFFNASDLPVRGFLVECIGHTRSGAVRGLLQLLAPLADALASAAPSAAKELDWLRSLVSRTSSLNIDDAKKEAFSVMGQQRGVVTADVAKVIRGSQFEKAYRRLKAGANKDARRGPISADEILTVLSAAETSSISPRAAVSTTADKASRDALDADGVLRFLYYFLSYRSQNIDAYKNAFCGSQRPLSVSTVLGSLVDFDYWLDCPPISSHVDQIALYQFLAGMHGDFFKPVVAYNPWTDIEQNGAGLARVEQAKALGFVAAKIYPPTGFMPAENATTEVHTRKRRPKLTDLDRVLDAFFAKCVSLQLPVIAHAEHTNGRDNAHDEFSSPTAWRKLLSRYSSSLESPVIDLGHFGGGGADKDVYWTKQFAELMGTFPSAPLFADLGYWVDFMDHPESEKYKNARMRLDHALRTPVGDKSAADRVMFGSDWLMLSQVDNWPDYPARVHAALREIASPEVIAKIFSGNAKSCFHL